MRFTKHDPTLGEIVVETESKAEAAELRAAGFQQDDKAAKSGRAGSRRKDSTDDASTAS